MCVCVCVCVYAYSLLDLSDVIGMMSDITNKYDKCVAGSISLKVFSVHLGQTNDLIGPKFSVNNH